MTSPNFSIDAERELIGSLILDVSAADRIECDLRPAHFYREDHRRIFSMAMRLIDEGKSADYVTLCNALEAAGESNDVLATVGEIAASVFSTAGVRQYAQIVVDRAVLRSLQAVADQVQAIAESPAGTVSEKVGEAQKLVMSLSDSASLSEREPQRVVDLMPTYLSMVEERWERRGGGLDTGFPDLDKRLNGGLADGAFVVLAARPAMGKTALALQIAEHFASSGRTALVLSQEMQSTQLIDRAAAFVGRVGLTKILTGEGMTADDHDRFFGAIAKINDLPLVLDEQGALRIEDIRRKARRVKSRHGLSLIVIDYLQLMAGDGENRTREITQITAALKALAKELGVPVLALSQLNRGVEQRPNKRPVMADLRESGSIEQDADVIMALYRDEYYNSDSPAAGLAELLILKNRQGASGGFVPLVYQGECTRFDSMFGQWPERQEADAPKKRSRGFGG